MDRTAWNETLTRQLTLPGNESFSLFSTKRRRHDVLPMRCSIRLALLTAGLAFTIHPSWAADILPMKTNGFFHAERIDGRWWLIAPNGQPFISKGVTTVQFAQDKIHGTNIAPYGDTNQAKYGTREVWREAVVRRLIGWGFNTLGAWFGRGTLGDCRGWPTACLCTDD